MLKPGDKVIICAIDEAYAFVDGWKGVISGFQSGHYEVKCQRDDGEKTLYVPVGQVFLSLGGY